MLDLSVDGLAEPIGVTASHPFWSVDRNTWVPAGELAPAEALGVLGDGTAAVLAIGDRSGTETVYNLEVARTHTYYVSDAKVWVHNSYVRVTSVAEGVKALKCGEKNVLIANQRDAEKVLRRAFPGIPVNRTYDEANRGKFGSEMHPADGGGPLDLGHYKWWDYRAGKAKTGQGARGHIFFEGL